MENGVILNLQWDKRSLWSQTMMANLGNRYPAFTHGLLIGVMPKRHFKSINKPISMKSKELWYHEKKGYNVPWLKNRIGQQREIKCELQVVRKIISGKEKWSQWSYQLEILCCKQQKWTQTNFTRKIIYDRLWQSSKGQKESLRTHRNKKFLPSEGSLS
jgi:hypothetical protein